MFERLLVAIDNSPGSDVALSFAVALAKQSGASVHVLHVNEHVVADAVMDWLRESACGKVGRLCFLRMAPVWR